MKVDYLIVGCGLAGINFCHLLKQHNKTFVVFDNNSQQSSTVAGGLYNPVVLKRFTPVWKSEGQLQLAKQVYAEMEQSFQVKLDYEVPVKRLFHSVEEQNDWFSASDKRGLSAYLSTKLISNSNPCIKAPLGFGEVLETGRIDTSLLLQCFIESLGELYFNSTFNYNELNIEPHFVQYQNITAKHVVFTEGFGLKQNPYFNYLPLKGTKGELLTIHAPLLKLDFVLKSNVFLIPLGDDLYRVGATYEWVDKTNTPTENGKQELLDKLKTVINCPFEVVAHDAGIRPTVIDRRPLVGTHPDYKNVHILNGLGTRGVMIAPYVAKALFMHIEHDTSLEVELDIKRFA